MSGGSQPGGQSFQSTSSTTTANPHPVVQPILQKGVDFLSGYVDKNPNAPELFKGSFTAPLSVASQSATQNYADLSRSGLGYGIDPASRQNAFDVLSGKYLDPSKNPALQKYLKSGFDVQNDEFNSNIVPNLRAQFQGSGRTGSGADFNVAMRSADALARAQAGAAAGAEAGAYGDERNRMQQMQSMLPSFQAMDLARAGMLEKAGQGIDSRTQRALDEAIYRDTYGKTGNLDYWSNIASRALGMYPGGQTQGTGTSSGYGTSSSGGGGFGGIAGPIMSGLGLGLQALGPMGFGVLSDRRDKTDIQELGVDPLTGLKTYAYRYKSDPKNTPKIVGPMAQDAERAGLPVREIGGRKVIAMPPQRPRSIDPLTGYPMAA